MGRWAAAERGTGGALGALGRRGARNRWARTRPPGAPPGSDPGYAVRCVTTASPTQPAASRGRPRRRAHTRLKGASLMAKHRRPAGVGRHRIGTPHRVHCRQMHSVRSRLEATPRFRYRLFRLRGRHTVVALTRSGVRPRPAFVLIASL